MKEVAIEVRGTKEEADGSLTPVVATIFSPEKTEGHNEQYCVVHCPYIFDNDKKIPGVVLEEEDVPTTPKD